MALREKGSGSCHFCGDPMTPDMDLDLDHTPDRSGYRGLAHADCNRRDGQARRQASQPPGAPVSSAVAQATLRQLQSLGEAHSPLGQVALTLARTLDEGAGMATAAVAREFRATLKELTPRDGGDAFQKLMDELSAEVRHS